MCACVCVSLSKVEFSLVNVVSSDTCMLMAHNSVDFKHRRKREKSGRWKDIETDGEMTLMGEFFSLCVIWVQIRP